MQVLGQLRGRARELHRVVEATAMQGPEFATDAVFFQLIVFGRREAAVEKDEIEGRADPGDGDDHVQPAHQQVGPIEQVGFHGTST